MFERLLGKDRPDGTARDAFRLLQAGNIDRGRELLRRLIKHEPANFEALALGLFEIIRPPKDGPEARRRGEMLDRLDPGANENLSIFVCATWTDPSDLTIRRYSDISKSTPRCIHGHAFRLLATIAMSDMEIQSGIRPGQQITSANVTYALKGLANLELRNHEIARDCFSRGAQEADAIVEFYSERMKVPVSVQASANLVEGYRLLCETGLALTLRDQGRTSEAGKIFHRLAAQTSPLAEDLRPLADEAGIKEGAFHASM
jgi:hypothetical protein